MSWCAADVYQLYGDVGLVFPSNLALPEEDAPQTDVIYPTLNPRGDPVPAPAPASGPAPAAAPPANGQRLPLYGPQSPPAPRNGAPR